ncbi:cytochrome ubiquinol oxidase subunit I [Thiotrichales bacterium 19S11-10]|nr:cytochrome ubiquinol oxidase subunit I [Thiotrichales bacterium 19S11-10]MCF6808019.1 cytochrome ubiquinol oxidase subunit I [Thiotrichales bacterium 19S9-11]MCF6812034.1 cytochrome ubiquinol oxidase subunit I [Thiotrichales bacterium 19S9-12]
MLPTLLSVELARFQFAFVAMIHFIFVPLTLGLTWILFTMELMYVKTGKVIYKDMTRFWGKLLGINFALGVLTGLTMEFSFGLNWAYYSQFVGDIFGTPLAIEGLVAFMLESTFLGIFFFGWNKLSKKQHLMATFFLALGSNLSALLILVANGFMQVPIGGEFVWETMRMQTTNLAELFINPIAQIGFAHTVFAGYTTASIFVIGISAFYLLRKRDVAFAKRSMAIGLGFGLISSIMVIFMGDQQGLNAYHNQPLKLAAIEAEWGTQKPPADFNAIAFPSQKAQKNIAAIQIPDALGYLVTHSKDTKIYGIKDILYNGYETSQGKKIPAMTTRIQNGALAYDALMKMQQGKTSQQTKTVFERYKNDLGFGMLLIPYMPQGQPLASASKDMIKQIATESVPDVFSLFWSFRIMVLMGVLMFLMILAGIFFTLRKSLWEKRWLLRVMLYMIPAPWVASMCGWFVTEHGRQPWTVYDMLPTSLSASYLSSVDIIISLVAFALFYAVLVAVELYLMFKFSRLGPSSLHTGKYHFEQNASLQTVNIGDEK